MGPLDGHAYGRAPEQAEEPLGPPDSPEGMEALSWDDLKRLAAVHLVGPSNGTPVGEARSVLPPP